VCRDCGKPLDDHVDLSHVMRLHRGGLHVARCQTIVPWNQWDRYTKFTRQELDEIDRNKRKAARDV